MAKMKRKEMEIIRLLSEQIEHKITELELAQAQQSLKETGASHLKESITQSLIDVGAYDVAKSYIDFLKAKNSALEKEQKTISVSATRKKTKKKAQDKKAQGFSPQEKEAGDGGDAHKKAGF